MNKIYLPIPEDEKPKNILDLLTWGFERGKNIGDGNMFCITYTDKGCMIKQCPSARRSFGDLLIICKTYFPKTTKKQLAKCLLELWNTMFIGMYYCHNINKVVFRQYTHSSSPTEGIVFYKFDLVGDDGYSINKILELQKS